MARRVPKRTARKAPRRPPTPPPTPVGAGRRIRPLAWWLQAAMAGTIVYVVLRVLGHGVMGEAAVGTAWRTLEVVGSIVATAGVGGWLWTRRCSLPAWSRTHAMVEPPTSGRTPAYLTTPSVSGRVAAPQDPALLIHELSLLYEIAHGVSSTIEFTELLEKITELLQSHLQLRDFALLLMDADRQYLQVKAAFGFEDPNQVQNMIFHVGEGVTGAVARMGRPLYVRDTRRDRRFLRYHGEVAAEGSFLSVPLWYQKEILGVVNFSRHGVASFRPHEVRLLQLIANQIAMALANARLYSRTRELAVRDELTGLYNRRHFQEVLQIEWKRAVRFRRPIGVLMVDVDHFKSFNDTHGHLHGDQVLRHLAEILRRNLREVDTVARFGGEEFIILLPDTERAGALHVAEKLRRIVEHEPLLLPKQQGAQTLSISVGVSVYPDDAEQIEDLIDHADIALYEAKDTGRNRVVCYPVVATTAEPVGQRA